MRDSVLDVAGNASAHVAAVDGMLTTRKIMRPAGGAGDDDVFELDVPVNLTLLHTHSDDEHDSMLASLVELAAKTLVCHTTSMLEQGTDATANDRDYLADLRRVLATFQPDDFVIKADFTKDLCKSAVDNVYLDATHKQRAQSANAVEWDKAASEQGYPDYVFDVMGKVCANDCTTSPVIKEGAVMRRNFESFAARLASGTGVPENNYVTTVPNKKHTGDMRDALTTMLFVPTAASFLENIDGSMTDDNEAHAHSQLQAVLNIVDGDRLFVDGMKDAAARSFVAAVHDHATRAPTCGGRNRSSNGSVAETRLKTVCDKMKGQGLTLVSWAEDVLKMRLANSNAGCRASLHEALAHTQKRPVPPGCRRRYFRLTPAASTAAHDGVLDFDHGAGWSAGETASPRIDALYAVLSFVASRLPTA